MIVIVNDGTVEATASKNDGTAVHLAQSLTYASQLCLWWYEIEENSIYESFS